MQPLPPRRELIDAERHVPELLQEFLVDLEATRHSSEVWQLIIRLGQTLNLPFIDFITASNYADWKRTTFIRTSYDSTWLNDLNKDPDVQKWSYFRTHAMHYLTPIAVGLEFVDEYRHIPEKRVHVLREAARRGIRAGFSIPLRAHAPPQAALITFSGNHSRREMQVIIRNHGWLLQTAALMGHQHFVMHFANEFPERNRLSAKQSELLKLIGNGYQDKHIAEALGVSISAVRQRMKAVMRKTGLGNRAELAALAMSIGLLPDPLRQMGSDEVIIQKEMGMPSVRQKLSRPSPRT
ncbi:helix-turn-helix transcriptional regulator [Shimia biformata]|uniref:helix-turn-helix transcriptional regulator n=1 Tax=Shimia biformata TaxID=1294299 RepID=UPI001950038F|nr:LuxR family transcriptional regulator [Shimia biformata]